MGVRDLRVTIRGSGGAGAAGGRILRVTAGADASPAGAIDPSCASVAA
jgi:hypothetical protein